MISRRILLGGLAASALPSPTVAASPEPLTVDAHDGHVDLTRFAADGAAKRAAVLILHGARGLEINPRAYERYAGAIATAGMDAYLVRYMTAGDLRALGQTSAREKREAYETQRFDAWAERVSSIATAIMARADSTGRIGLLGFSLGGYIAAESGARDEHIAALAVMYGGMPDAMASEVKRMPPLLEIHGDADRNVPLAKGEELVKLAKAVGAPAEQVTYPGRAHGFDFSDTDPMTSDAIGRVVRFFQVHLTAA
jgi:carboxymethylenebutenolidase